jgi:hypothetical protein
MNYRVEIISGGKKIELNDFAERIVLGTLLGLLGSLRDVDIKEKITLAVTPSP